MLILSIYDTLLEIDHYSEKMAIQELRKLFDTDFKDPLHHRNFAIEPLPENVGGFEHVFRHLTTKESSKGGSREFDRSRSKRLHWVKHHLIEKTQETHPNHKIECFRIQEGKGERYYILNFEHRYVVVLEPLRQKAAFYLLTAYHFDEERRFNDLKKKYERSKKAKSASD